MRARPLSYHELHVWAFQLKVMLAAGVPLVIALRSIARSEMVVMAGVCSQLAQKLSEGHSLSGAMRSQEGVFSPFVVNLVLVGEQSGKLIAVLDRISSRSARRDKMRRAVLGAIAYPAVLAGVSVAMSLCMAIFMFPRLLPFLTGLGVPLPWPTRALMWFTENLSPLLLAFTIVAAYSGRVLASGTSGWATRLRSWVMYYAPVIGSLNVDRIYADTLDDLCLLVEADCDLVKGLKTLRVDWPEFGDRINACVERVTTGTPFSDAAHASGLFPDRFALQVRTAEETGKLAPIFRLLSDSLHETVTLKAEQIVQLMEPAILTGMGIVTGFVVVAIFMPLYGMATAAL